MPVWKIDSGSFSFTTIRPPVSGSFVTPSSPMFPIVVPSFTVCAAARVSVPPATYVNRSTWRSRSSVITNWPPPT